MGVVDMAARECRSLGEREGTRSEYPDIEEQEEDSEKKAKPDSPADAGALGHAKHTGHIPPETGSGVVE